MLLVGFDRQIDYLSKENTHCLKGILAIGILAHHIYQHSGLFRTGWLRLFGGCLQGLGFVTVALFFFLSGYGLIAAYRKNPQSIYDFGKHKILPFYLIDLILIVIYLYLHSLSGYHETAVSIIKSLTFGGTVIVNGWYIQVQLLYYIMFYLVFRCCGEKWRMPVMLGLHAVYMTVCILAGLSSNFYERTFIFVAGMFWYENREKIDGWIEGKKYRWLILWLASCVLFAITYLMSYCALTVLFRGVSYFFFVPAVILLLKRVVINNKVTSFLGGISLEIYVLQGIFLVLFHSEKFYISNPYLYVLAVAASTIAAAFISHPLFQSVYRLCRKL